MRNVGGRVTPEALRSWALLGLLGVLLHDGKIKARAVITPNG